jgi:hypothetical protein
LIHLDFIGSLVLEQSIINPEKWLFDYSFDYTLIIININNYFITVAISFGIRARILRSFTEKQYKVTNF